MEGTWDIDTYESARGEKIVDEFIKEQQPQAIAKIAHAINLLAKFGNMLGMPYSKSLGSGLYELRIRGKEELRIVYCFGQRRKIYLLHGLKKQTEKTPLKELKVAQERMETLTLV